MYLVTGHFTFKPSALGKAQGIMSKIMEKGRTERGIIRYTFYADPAEETRYFLFEEWESQETHDAHFNSEFMQAIVPELMNCFAKDMDVKYYEAELA